MQYRNPVGAGPSSNTCPRCASHRRHSTAIRHSYPGQALRLYHPQRKHLRRASGGSRLALHDCESVVSRGSVTITTNPSGTKRLGVVSVSYTHLVGRKSSDVGCSRGKLRALRGYLRKDLLLIELREHLPLGHHLIDVCLLYTSRCV